MKAKKPKIKTSDKIKGHYGFICDSFLDDEDYTFRGMFGCLAIYKASKIMLVLANGKEPWNGILVPTEREYHPSLIEEFSLISHKILGKWLYMSQKNSLFEKTATALVQLILNGDRRIGTIKKN